MAVFRKVREWLQYLHRAYKEFREEVYPELKLMAQEIWQNLIKKRHQD